MPECLPPHIQNAYFNNVCYTYCQLISRLAKPIATTPPAATAHLGIPNIVSSEEVAAVSLIPEVLAATDRLLGLDTLPVGAMLFIIFLLILQ